MRRRLKILGALLAGTLHAPANGQELAPALLGDARQVETQRRVRVELFVWGKLSEKDESTLFGLLQRELSTSGLVLRRSETPPSSERDFALSTGSTLTLMRAVLDVRSVSDWRITILDVEREKTLVRLQRGPARNAAALEASVSILAAAAVALHEGFEIAPPPPASPVPAPAAEALPPPPLQIFSTLGMRVATLERSVPLQFGPAVAVGLRLHQEVAFRLSASHFFAERFESRFGSFDLDRTRLALGGGPVWAKSAFDGEVSFGVSAEVLRRRNAAPVAGVNARPSSQVFRAGAEGEVRVRYRLLKSLGLELGAGAAYFPQAVRFSAASGTDPVLAAPFKFVALGGASLELSAP